MIRDIKKDINGEYFLQLFFQNGKISLEKIYIKNLISDEIEDVTSIMMNKKYKIVDEDPCDEELDVRMIMES